MENTIDDGGPAFSRPASVYGTGNSKSPDDWRNEQQGMTLRDYLAAAALTGLIVTPVTDNDDAAKITRTAYHYADLMLKARKLK